MTWLLQNMKISVKFSVTVRVDNVGSCFMAGKVTAMSHTKHLDIRYKYVNKLGLVEGGIIKFVFVKSAENNNIIVNKNLSGEQHENIQRN